MEEQKTVKQAGKFVIVGVFNTVIDFGVLNILVFLGFTAAFTLLGQEFLVANIISVAMAMINSFILNKQWTFRSEGENIYIEVIKFLTVTVIGMFVIHQLIFSFFYYRFYGATDLAISLVHLLRLNTVFSDKFVVLNFAKGIAIIGSFVWNFLGYKFFVFKEEKTSAGNLPV